MRYSTAASMNIELQRIRTMTLRREISDSPASRIHTKSAIKAAVQIGTCAQRIATIAETPGESMKAPTGAKANHSSGVWCSQKSRYGTSPCETHFVTRKNSISSQVTGCSHCSVTARAAAARMIRTTTKCSRRITSREADAAIACQHFPEAHKHWPAVLSYTATTCRSARSIALPFDALRKRVAQYQPANAR